MQITDVLAYEPVLAGCSLRDEGGERRVLMRAALTPPCWINVAVGDGVVTLDGRVPGLTHKQIAGVLAWWVPGTRDVMNNLCETAPIDDVDDELTDIVSRMLKRDPPLDASRIAVYSRNAAVELDGVVPTEPERNQAEFDAWYVFGVDQVENHLDVGG